MAQKKPDSRDDRKVREQYEALPYPQRDPADEAERLIVGSPSGLWELNHYVFGGARDWRLPFRALAAGGGTGDATIMLAQQLADAGIDATVCHLDLSAAAQDVTRARAAQRGLDNIEYRQGSLLDLDPGDGLFDYIDCCGVLHHLDDPAAGLSALARVLAPGGGIGCMVYGELGRTGVYHVQEIARALAPDDMELGDRLATARRLVDGLPPTNWLVRNPFVGDHVTGGDPGLYDLLLHSRDRAYRVPDLHELAGRAGLRIVGFIEPARYEPVHYLQDPQLIARAVGLDAADRARLAELLAGNMITHVFYAVAADNAVAPPAPDRPEACPVLRDMTPGEAARLIPAGGLFKVSHGGLEVRLAMPPLAKAMVRLCDGEATLADIHRAIAEKRSELEWDAFARQFAQLYAALNGINRMVLRLPPAAG